MLNELQPDLRELIDLVHSVESMPSIRPCWTERCAVQGK